jgi:hypothetical protein
MVVQPLLFHDKAPKLGSRLPIAVRQHAPTPPQDPFLPPASRPSSGTPLRARWILKQTGSSINPTPIVSE